MGTFYLFGIPNNGREQGNRWLAGRDITVGFVVAPLVAVTGILLTIGSHYIITFSGEPLSWTRVYQIELGLSLLGSLYVYLTK